jgi:uncharacterized protein
MDPALEEKSDEIQAYVKGIFQASGSHGYDHVLRVTRLCESIGAREGADMAVLIPAALLHDIARPIEEECGIPHEIEGDRIAERFLREIRYDERLIPAVIHAIRAHRFSTDTAPETLEAQILSDADKLDAMGAIGIARTFMKTGEKGGDILDAAAHIHEKLLKLKSRMYTHTGRELAEERHLVLTAFARALEDEMNTE